MAVCVSDGFFSYPVHSDEGFCAWYVGEFMKTHLPTQYYSVSDDSKHEMVLNGRRYAQARGLEDPQSQAHFITLMWEVGADFFRHPGFAEIFADTALTGPQKIDRCYEVPSDTAAKAMMQADPLYWYPSMVARRQEMRS